MYRTWHDARDSSGRDRHVPGRHAQGSRRSQEASRIAAPLTSGERSAAVNRSSPHRLRISHRTLNIRHSDAGRLSLRPERVEYRIRGGDPMDRIEVEYEYGPTATSAHHTMGESPSLNEPLDTDTNAGTSTANSDVPTRSAHPSSTVDPRKEVTDWNSDADTCLDSSDDENSLNRHAHEQAQSAATANVAPTGGMPPSLLSADES